MDHVLISEVQLTGGAGATAHDFIEFYNPTDQAVDISGWKLRKRTQSGNESSMRVFGDGKSIPAHGFFLWANAGDGFAASLGADESSTASIAANNSIAIEDSSGAVIDTIAWGENLTNPFSEETALTAVLDANQSFERKAWQENCVSAAGAGEALGNGCDTNDNSADFEIRAVSAPQNSESSLEL